MTAGTRREFLRRVKRVARGTDANPQATRGFTLAEKIAFYTRVEAATGCVLWTGRLTPHGYGKLFYRGRELTAHRAAYELANGPIAPGLFACHRCDTPACVNPAHIFLGAPRDNVQDSLRKGRRADQRCSRNGNARLTYRDVTEIRRRSQAGETYKDIARSYEISAVYAGSIVRGECWTGDPRPRRRRRVGFLDRVRRVARFATDEREDRWERMSPRTEVIRSPLLCDVPHSAPRARRRKR